MSHHRQIFLDHASTTPVHPDALGVMLPYFGNHFASSGTSYELGRRSRKAVEQARSRVAQLIGARPQEIVFTSSGTEANNMAILGEAYERQSRGRHIITSSIEHAGVLSACRHLEQKGFRVTYLPVDKNAVVDVSALEDAICDETILISIMHANNEVGTIEPIGEIGRIAREKAICFHCDAVQSAGKIPVGVDDLHVNLLSIASHKIYGPKGVGALYIRTGTDIKPILFGSDQERGLRPGSHNVPGIVGFGMACEIAKRDLEANTVLVKTLREFFEQQIVQRLPGVTINGSGAHRLPHISSISFTGINADSIAAGLDAYNISVSSGSPVSSYKKQLSHVLEAMQVGPESAHGTLRFSLGWENKKRDIKHTVECLERIVEGIREFSRSIDKDHISIFTFPDKQAAVSADKVLKGAGFSYILTAKPFDIAEVSSTHIALACTSNDKKKIGVILGEHGIEIAGVHRIQSQCETERNKEQKFWAKVEEIKKDLI
jgi:cysteine desulfurase